MGGDVKSLAWFPTRSHITLLGEVKQPTSLFEKSRGRNPRFAVLLLP